MVKDVSLYHKKAVVEFENGVKITFATRGDKVMGRGRATIGKRNMRTEATSVEQSAAKLAIENHMEMLR